MSREPSPGHTAASHGDRPRGGAAGAPGPLHPEADSPRGRGLKPPPLLPRARPETTCRFLSNGEYRVLLTARGTGSSSCGRYALTAWRGDRVADPEGFFVSLRDLEDGRTWSLGRLGGEDSEISRSAAWEPGVFSLSCRTAGIEARLETCVVPDAAAEIRRLTLVDRSGRRRRLEVTTCAEVVLAEPAAHAAHPAFAKLFVQTESVPGARALLARRRPRASGEAHPWMVHAWLGRQAVTWETDRTRFIGRGRSLQNPAALATSAPLSGTTGNVLDPIFALRGVVEVEPRGSASVAWLLGAGSDRQTALDVAERYTDATSVESAMAAARHQADTDLDRLGIGVQEAGWAQALAGAMLYGHPALRAGAAVLARAAGWTPSLSRHGLVPQRACAVLHAERAEGGLQLPQLLRAHALWVSLGLPIDLVVLRGEAGVPDAALDLVADTGRSLARDPMLGRVLVIPSADLTPPDIDALDAAARLVVHDRLPELALDSALSEHPVETGGEARQPASAEARLTRSEPRAAPTPGLEVAAGFAAGGQEYVIPVQLENGTLRLPPRPWINVVANERFGFLVSETGAGSTWSRNSREHRLTPWSNDALLDPHAEAYYARDDDTNEIWSLFPGPAPAEAPYEVRHGWGTTLCRHASHGLEHEIQLFVPRADPLRIARVQLVNRGSAPRRLSLFAYAQLVLGGLPEESGRFVVTEAGLATGALFARNSFAGEFSDGVAFAAVTGSGVPAAVHFTADRAAFLGPEGSVARPAALGRGGVLDGRTGAGLEPCFVHQATLTLEPGATAELAFLLGEGSGRAEAHALVARYASFAAIERAQREVIAFWQGILTGVQIRTPVPAIDLMVNGWLAYQTLACRIWARTALYQSGGAFGFRDQLQDAAALVCLRTRTSRASRSCCTPPTSSRKATCCTGGIRRSDAGIRTRFADDLLWLPYLTASYVRATGDAGVLDERVRFLTARALAPGEDEAYLLPRGRRRRQRISTSTAAEPSIARSPAGRTVCRSSAAATGTTA